MTHPFVIQTMALLVTSTWRTVRRKQRPPRTIRLLTGSTSCQIVSIFRIRHRKRVSIRLMTSPETTMNDALIPVKLPLVPTCAKEVTIKRSSRWSLCPTWLIWHAKWREITRRGPRITILSHRTKTLSSAVVNGHLARIRMSLTTTS